MDRLMGFAWNRKGGGTARGRCCGALVEGGTERELLLLLLLRGRLLDDDDAADAADAADAGCWATNPAAAFGSPARLPAPGMS